MEGRAPVTRTSTSLCSPIKLTDRREFCSKPKKSLYKPESIRRYFLGPVTRHESPNLQLGSTVNIYPRIHTNEAMAKARHIKAVEDIQRSIGEVPSTRSEHRGQQATTSVHS